MKPLNAEIIRLYTEEMKSCDQIADVLADSGVIVSCRTISAQLKKAGVQMRTIKEARRLRTDYRSAT